MSVILSKAFIACKSYHSAMTWGEYIGFQYICGSCENGDQGLQLELKRLGRAKTPRLQPIEIRLTVKWMPTVKYDVTTCRLGSDW